MKSGKSFMKVANFKKKFLKSWKMFLKKFKKFLKSEKSFQKSFKKFLKKFKKNKWNEKLFFLN